MLPAQLSFSLNAEQIGKNAARIIEKKKTVHDQIANIDLTKVTRANTLEPLLNVDNEFRALSASCYFPMYMHEDSEVRNASSAANESMEKAEVELSGRKDVYARLKTFFENEKTNLDELDTRLLTKILRGYQRQGVDLEETQFERLQTIRKRLSELSIQFQKSLNEEKTKLFFTKEQLKGMPEDYISALPEVSADDDKANAGKKIVSLKYTDLFPVLQNCSVPETREALDSANSSKCPENVQLIEEALDLRREAAKLLGFDSHAHFVLEQRMAKEPSKVKAFLDDLVEKLTPKAKEERVALVALKKAFCQENSLEFSDSLTHAEWRFYQNQRLKNEFAVDNNAIKKYFPMSKVTDELLNLYQKLFAVTFKEIVKSDDGHRTWHEDVRQFEVIDTESKQELGTFYLDLHPREGKYGHAAVFPLVCTRHENGKRQPVVAAMLANFTKPTADQESLLFHNEVVTYFHEFGHVVHSICSQSKYAMFSGTSVERDFVEAPSQMLENWCWSKNVLQKLTSHVETKETLPDDLIDKMLAAKNADTGLFNKRQLFFGALDQKIHGAESAGDTTKLWHAMWTEFTGIDAPEGAPIASFGHLMGGYSASYYGYLWSEVYSSDMFSLFESNVFDFDLGKRYRDCILAPGYTRDSDESLRMFLGREPTNDAFLKHIGL